MHYSNPALQPGSLPAGKKQIFATGGQFGGQPVAQAEADPSTKAGVIIILLCVYVFLVYSRAPEIIGTYIGNVHLPMILMGILTCCCFFNGWLGKTFLSVTGMGLLGFTIWMFCCIPMSVWPGGSFRTVVFDWLPAFVTFYVTASLLQTLRDAERVFRAVGFGLVAIFLIYLIFGGHAGTRAEASIGTMGNPNLFALQLLMGMPFCLYGIYRRGIVSLKGGFYILILLLNLYVTVSTGSRSGLLGLGIGLMILWLRCPPLGKVGLLALTFIWIISATAILPRATLVRYMAMFSSDRSIAGGDLEMISAMESAEARRHHLEQSIQLTVQHPVFGVGPGQFRVASATLSQVNNERAAWLETHNSWTQVSSETGFPGIVCYLAAVLFCLKRLWSQYRAIRKRPELSALADMTFCLLLAFALLIVTMTFASAAYQLDLPLLCGLALGLLRVSRNAINQPSAAPAAQPFTPPVWEKRTVATPGTPVFRGPRTPFSY